MPNLTSNDIYEILKGILVDDFEIESDNISLDSNLFDDLELDSVDAVDLAVRLQQYTQKKDLLNDNILNCNRIFSF